MVATPIGNIKRACFPYMAFTVARTASESERSSAYVTEPSKFAETTIASPDFVGGWGEFVAKFAAAPSESARGAARSPGNGVR